MPLDHPAITFGGKLRWNPRIVISPIAYAIPAKIGVIGGFTLYNCAEQRKIEPPFFIRHVSNGEQAKRQHKKRSLKTAYIPTT